MIMNDCPTSEDLKNIKIREIVYYNRKYEIVFIGTPSDLGYKFDYVFLLDTNSTNGRNV
jgi:hypothetical protein